MITISVLRAASSHRGLHAAPHTQGRNRLRRGRPVRDRGPDVGVVLDDHLEQRDDPHQLAVSDVAAVLRF
ncbi:hypothetical protein ACNF49_39420 [Actinomadura sp. ATCC 39365]